MVDIILSTAFIKEFQENNDIDTLGYLVIVRE